MRIRMIAARILQEAGRERPLSVGVEYDAAEGVALDLIASGAATRGGLAPPETKPDAPPETKRGRR
jgi:hypothetical protein